MKDGPDIAGLASLIGDPARANMLGALMSGYALTAGELAREAGITAQTASAHLTRMVDAGLILVEVQGRHRYHRIAGSDVAEGIESLMGLAARMGRLRTRPGPADKALRQARFCYDHLAGEVGTALYEALVEQGLLVATREGIGLSPAGRSRFIAEGIDLADAEKKRRPLCRACLDWSTRRHHLGGLLGALVAELVIARGWATRKAGTRQVVFNPGGVRAFERFVGRSTARDEGGAISR